MTTPVRKIPTRRVSLDEAFRTVPRHFMGEADPVSSHFFAALSATFPEGEDFFVRSVRHYRDRIEAPELKRDVAGFIGQEAIHGREHRVFNERLSEVGYTSKQVDRVVGRLIRWRERALPPISNLAVTAAMEHFTATLAELMLTNTEARSMFGDGPARDLFTWHALEESEHKAVAFDVYRSVGGSERTRIWTMKFVRVMTLISLAVIMTSSLVKDPIIRRPRELWASFRRLWNSPWMSKQVWAQLHEYDRPGFHPNDIDTSAIVDEWQETLFGAQGSLKDSLLAGVA